MDGLFHDRRLYRILIANIFSSIGTGITMIAVPWFLVTQKGGEVLFGYITVCMTIIMFLVAPFVGVIVDRFSRKRILLAGETIGFIVVGLFSILGIFGLHFVTWHYVVLYASGSLYYTLFYPTSFAFNQEIFSRKQYKSLNGLMEIQGQLSSVISGGLASIMMTAVSFKWILLIDTITYMGAFWLFLFIPYSRKMVEMGQSIPFKDKFIEGYRYMKKFPSVFIFLLASLMPFLAVMATNYVFPVYISNVLKGNAKVYGIQEIFYGTGAILAGLIIPFLLKKMGSELSIVLTVTIYTIGMTLLFLINNIPFFYLMSIMLAIGNAGTRVARNSYMMENIPNDKIGRVDSLFRVIGLGIRIVLLLIFTKMIDVFNAVFPLKILSIILFVVLFAIICNLRYLPKSSMQIKADI